MTQSQKRRPLTDEQKQQIYHLRGERGLSCKQIALKLNVDAGAVSWHCLMLGVERAGRKPGLHKIASAERYTYTRKGFPVRGYTAEDDQLLLKLEAEGLRYTEIGRRMNPQRRYNSIRARLATLARREAREEEMQAA